MFFIWLLDPTGEGASETSAAVPIFTQCFCGFLRDAVR